MTTALPNPFVTDDDHRFDQHFDAKAFMTPIVDEAAFAVAVVNDAPFMAAIAELAKDRAPEFIRDPRPEFLAGFEQRQDALLSDSRFAPIFELLRVA